MFSLLQYILNSTMSASQSIPFLYRCNAHSDTFLLHLDQYLIGRRQACILHTRWNSRERVDFTGNRDLHGRTGKTFIGIVDV